MGIKWESLGLVSVVSLGVSVAVVALVSFALVGLSARASAKAAAANPGGPHDGAAPPLNANVGTAIAGVCLLAVLAIVGYGLYTIVA
ncbi:hypothetical protein [Pseudonocardia phyllosphaerae]|uniref:hypothetical protein n=1 Tax=Pseudonocardia phyllosphaerae TaxID=3390502 RepID=UPI00397E2604